MASTPPTMTAAATAHELRLLVAAKPEARQRQPVLAQREEPGPEDEPAVDQHGRDDRGQGEAGRRLRARARAGARDRAEHRERGDRGRGDERRRAARRATCQGTLAGSQAARQAEGLTVARPLGAGGELRRRPVVRRPVRLTPGPAGGCQRPSAACDQPCGGCPAPVGGLPPAGRRLPGRLPAAVGRQPPARRRHPAAIGGLLPAGRRRGLSGLRRPAGWRRGLPGRRRPAGAGGVAGSGGPSVARPRRSPRATRTPRRRGPPPVLVTGLVVHCSPVSGRRRFYTQAAPGRAAGVGGVRDGWPPVGGGQTTRRGPGGFVAAPRRLVYSRLAGGRAGSWPAAGSPGRSGVR